MPGSSLRSALGTHSALQVLPVLARSRRPLPSGARAGMVLMPNLVSSVLLEDVVLLLLGFLLSTLTSISSCPIRGASIITSILYKLSFSSYSSWNSLPHTGRTASQGPSISTFSETNHPPSEVPAIIFISSLSGRPTRYRSAPPTLVQMLLLEILRRHLIVLRLPRAG